MPKRQQRIDSVEIMASP